jgi:UDP-N-acetylglucosamine transferase subunit ALG13
VNAPRIVVSLGTDVHPFERLLGWAESLAERLPEVALLVQHGASRAPVGRAAGIRATDRDTLLGWYRGADVVITQGGPGSILDAREAGKIPLVVPRDPALGEHVDGHQQAFVPVMAKAGEAVLVETFSDLVRLVDEGIADPQRFRAPVRRADPAPAAAALSRLVTAALSAAPERGRLARRLRLLLPSGHRPAAALTPPHTEGVS